MVSLCLADTFVSNILNLSIYSAIELQACQIIMECGLYCATPVRHDAVCVNTIIMVQHAVRVNSVRYKTSRCLFFVSASSRHVMQREYDAE